MSILSKAKDFFGLSDEMLDADQEYYQEVYNEPVAVTPSRQNVVEKTYEEPVAPIAKEKPVQAAPTRSEEKVVSMRQVPKAQPRRTTSSSANRTADAAGKITILEPRVYSESMAIAKRIINGEAVLVNFHLVEEEQARRIVDFLTGTVYAQDGDIKRVGDEIFLCTPKGMEIDGTEQSLTENQMFDL